MDAYAIESVQNYKTPEPKVTMDKCWGRANCAERDIDSENMSVT